MTFEWSRDDVIFFSFFSQAVMPVCVMHWLHLLALHRYKSLRWDAHSPVTSSCDLIQRVNLWLTPLHLLTYICLGTVEGKKLYLRTKKGHPLLHNEILKHLVRNLAVVQWKFSFPLFPVQLLWAERIETEALSPGVYQCQGWNLPDACLQSGSPVRE